MVFYVSNTPARDYPDGSARTLHVQEDCWTLGRDDRKGWEATLTEILDADRLCGACATAVVTSEG
jgi:hypothetical protein